MSRALKMATGRPIVVGVIDTYLMDNRMRKTRLPKKVIKFISDFYQGLPVKVMSFRIKVPHGW